MNRKVSFLISIMALSTFCFGQKVKYKELVLLLNAKQFDTAAPFLARYLKENGDNPNANLFMGIIFQDRTVTNDVLKHTDILLANSDSAVLFFDKAYALITEKELKRNDEYYQEMYSRRDPRTGEFVIKLSDVRLDMETRVKNIKERKEKVKELKKHFLDFEKKYTRCTETFKSLVANHSSENSFYLQSSETIVVEFGKLTHTFDSAVAIFNNYKSVLKQVAKSNYNQQLNVQEIKEWQKDGFSAPDLFADDLRIWDYKRWAKSATETIENVINPLRERLISYDIALNKLDDKLKKDSISVVADLAHADDGLLYAQLKKYDSDPLPLGVFEMKKAELRYKSSFISHKPHKDTSNVMLKLSYLNEELKAVNALDSISKKLVQRDLNKESENYRHFITKSYGTKEVLNSLIKTTQDYANREKLKKEIEWENTIQATKWAINGTDSIPLFFEQLKDLKFKPLVIIESKYTVGLQYKDSLAMGYLYSITPSRIPDVKATFPVDQVSFTKRNLPVLKCLTFADAQLQVFFSLIYSESKVDERFPITITKVYRTDGLAWSNNLKFDFLPTELIYAPETGELSIKISTLGENKIITLDKTGKQIQ